MVKLYKSAAWLLRKRAEGKSPEEMAVIAGTTHQTIRRWMQKFGVK